MIESVFPETESMQSQVKTYCIIGDPIHNSLSPTMQNAAFNSRRLNCIYIAWRVPKEQLKESVCSLRSTNISGFNVTIPHKVEVMTYMEELDSTAREANAVNTVNNIEGAFRGYNTDVEGFIEPLHKRDVDFNGMVVLLLGAGGAARAVIAALSNEKEIHRITIANRGIERTRELLKMASKLGLSCDTVGINDAQELAPKSHLIINATSIGMNDEQSIIDYKHIGKDSIVYDLVYRPITTNLLENAKYAGAKVIYGYEMLLAQGARAFEIWTGTSAPSDTMKKALFGVFGEPL